MSEKIIACNLTFNEIKELADKVINGDLTKVKIYSKGAESELCIEREKESAVTFTSAPPVPMPMTPPPAPMPPAAPAAVPAAPAAAPAAPAEPQEKVYEGNVVKSPIVGTYYSAPAPDKDPFVRVGDQVKKGDVIMIIESMKLMNEVTSDFDGVVTEILVDNGEAVEYSQPIMIIK